MALLQEVSLGTLSSTFTAGPPSPTPTHLQTEVSAEPFRAHVGGRRHLVGIHATSRKAEVKAGKARSITESSPGSIRDPSKMSQFSFDHPLPYGEFVISTPSHILTAYTLPNLPTQI